MHFHTHLIKAGPVTEACKTAKLFAFFHRSTQCERTIAFQAGLFSELIVAVLLKSGALSDPVPFDKVGHT